MADSEELVPLSVEYDPVTGVPPEFNEFLPPDCPEYKKWKGLNDAGLEGAVEKLSVSEKTKEGEEIEKRLPGGKVKKKAKPEILLERNIRNKRKCITTVSGLDTFKVKLSEASKLFGKKFASGASVVKTASGKEQIDIQGDCLDQLAELILKQYGKDNGITRKDIFFMDNKTKTPYFNEED
mmetsp:Transcript_30413/g.72355  ORF Transcript_30413/g.72355 Transcript_30413/m.72355 type:complete len:181 (+) Transcript_30413:92-634(+)